MSPDSQDQINDHKRDHRKNWIDDEPARVDTARKSDPVPARLDVPVPTAFDVASLVKLVDINVGAGLIEQYARTYAAGERR